MQILRRMLDDGGGMRMHRQQPLQGIADSVAEPCAAAQVREKKGCAADPAVARANERRFRLALPAGLKASQRHDALHPGKIKQLHAHILRQGIAHMLRAVQNDDAPVHLRQSAEMSQQLAGIAEGEIMRGKTHMTVTAQ